MKFRILLSALPSQTGVSPEPQADVQSRPDEGQGVRVRISNKSAVSERTSRPVIGGACMIQTKCRVQQVLTSACSDKGRPNVMKSLHVGLETGLVSTSHRLVNSNWRSELGVIGRHLDRWRYACPSRPGPPSDGV